MSQRLSSSARRPVFQRNMKLVGMMLELPSLLLAPLSLAFEAAGMHNVVEEWLAHLPMQTEIINLGIAATCGVLILFLRFRSASSHFCEELLHEYVYPITLDVLYIPLMFTFLRLTTCPDDMRYRIALPGGVTCQCVDWFGLYSSVGLAGFVLMYAGALRFKIYIEPLSTSMDFEFQSGYQIIMVMARTIDPLVAMLVNSLDVKTHVGQAVCILLAYLAVMLLLLVYSYKTQPCIGSGRVPNNIRVLSFSCAIYATLCGLMYLAAGGPHDNLYYELAALPVVGILAWVINGRRARHFHIPDVSILTLLESPQPQVRVVGAIAAFYVDAAKLHPLDHEGILTRLRELASSDSHPLCRTYAIQTLWFCHIAGLRKNKRVIGELSEALVMPHKLWLKDKTNNDRPLPRHMQVHRGGAHAKAPEKRIKVARINDIQVVTPTTVTAPKPVSHKSLKRRRSSVSASILAPSPCPIVRIRDKPWLSITQSQDTAADNMQDLYQRSLEVLLQNIGVDGAQETIALFLLQCYKARYWHLSKVVFLHVLAALCASTEAKFVIDAIHTAHSTCVSAVLPPSLWLRHPSAFHQLVLGLRQPSLVTVTKCAHVVAEILTAATTEANANTMEMLSQDAIAAIHAAFWLWHGSYKVSLLLERICMSLHALEAQAQKKRISSADKSPRQTFLNRLRGNGTYLPTSIRALVVLSKQSSKVSQRRSVVDPTVATVSPLEPSQVQPPTTPVPSMHRARTKRSILQVIKRSRVLPEAPRISMVSRVKVLNFVTPAILTEIERRQALRSQFESALSRASDACRVDARRGPASADAPRYHMSQRSEFLVSIVTKLYMGAGECAMVEFAATALDPELQSYFQEFVLPLTVQLQSPQRSLWRRLRRISR
ncbi:hypothetical protein SPRG_10260 [Saprolegnia parasitica CBS 223.65]|uniref:Uncharacterized protein n=1 Tax=Saprolegnia parasitica (strain CBS 223.65) TaxID=695850 RepID=A0A067CDX6_SAPPC|nr:hypothetical protein SPRG_10260 [Saprolegnia parasitica CBS 223.65]KDO24726.1 hypothetical protein SPRG_10260 [Saprolegnia parasitica CBS 223.65]|eukprot:XP_012204606.1 hypothetical protein SPRG_10260 [Saprolegnia parasitica CBS 223.65]